MKCIGIAGHPLPKGEGGFRNFIAVQKWDLLTEGEGKKPILPVWGDNSMKRTLACRLYGAVCAALVPGAAIGVGDSAQVRDLGARKDSGPIAEKYTAEVPRQGAVLIKVK
jgi:hypothetical protein